LTKAGKTMQPTAMRPDPLQFQIPISTAYTPSESYAGFWKRLGAMIIDQIILYIVNIFVAMPLIALSGFSLFTPTLDASDLQSGMFWLLLQIYLTVLVVSLVIQWLYYAILESVVGATPGKMLLRIQVTDLDGCRISFGRASLRYFGKIISSLILGIGYLMAGFSERKQALHDMLSGCLVVDS
jgi:uncharacterized RDD family membrane protein YckC